VKQGYRYRELALIGLFPVVSALMLMGSCWVTSGPALDPITVERVECHGEDRCVLTTTAGEEWVSAGPEALSSHRFLRTSDGAGCWELCAVMTAAVRKRQVVGPE